MRVFVFHVFSKYSSIAYNPWCINYYFACTLVLDNAFNNLYNSIVKTFSFNSSMSVLIWRIYAISFISSVI